MLFYRLFLNMELRHLVVMDNNFCPIGMITRKDIMYSKLLREAQEKVSQIFSSVPRLLFSFRSF
jgi:predicted transcriptional regulator